MKMFLFLLIAFIASVYIYTFIKMRKKRKMNTKTAVEEFNDKYHKAKTNKTQQTNDLPLNYRKQITKYNSNVDYLDKTDL